MSISNPTIYNTSPVQAYVRFKGSVGKLEYKPKGEDPVLYDPDKLSFVVLDDSIGCITGFKKEPITSNKLRKENKDGVFNVFIGKTLFQSGKWKDIKDNVKSTGGNFTKLLYCYCVTTDTLVEFAIKKQAIVKWNEFLDTLGLKLHGGAGVGFTLDKVVENTAGATNYFEHDFKGALAKKPEVIEKSKELDIILQNYLNINLNKNVTNNTSSDSE